MSEQELHKLKKILRFSASTGIKVTSREGTSLEFKESFNWNSKDKYGKSIAAFANNRGGLLVFGISDRPREILGLKTTNFEDLDEAIITQYLNSMFSPEIEFEKQVHKIRGKNIGVLSVKSSINKPVVALKTDNDIREGEIYYRYIGRNERIKFPELRSILELVRELERKHWRDLFERVSRIGPENAAVMNVSEGNIGGPGGTILIDKKLLPKLKFIKEGSFKEKGKPVLKLIGDVKPVSLTSTPNTSDKRIRVTDDPTFPMVRVEEENLLKNFPLDFEALTKTLKARYSNFKVNKQYHKARKSLIGKGFSITRELNPGNPKTSRIVFFSHKIITEFDKIYTKK